MLCLGTCFLHPSGKWGLTCVRRNGALYNMNLIQDEKRDDGSWVQTGCYGSSGMSVRAAGRASWQKCISAESWEREIYNSICRPGGVKLTCVKQRSRCRRGPGIFWEQPHIQQSWSRDKEAGRGSERRDWMGELERDPEGLVFTRRVRGSHR